MLRDHRLVTRHLREVDRATHQNVSSEVRCLSCFRLTVLVGIMLNVVGYVGLYAVVTG